MSISVLIITRNEEANLPGCLASLTWGDDIVVLDSFSTDKTVAIAEVRRRGLKRLAHNLPCRPALHFIHMYFLRRGFLDGWSGYVYRRLIAGYEFMILLKTAGLRRCERGLRI